MTKTEGITADPPRMEDHPAFRVTGLAIDCPNFDTSGIPALWQDLNTRASFDPGSYPDAAYGVCFDGTADGFRYLAGYRDSGGELDGATCVDLPAGRYAVFTHRGDIGGLPSFVSSIWNEALGAHGLTPAKAPDFEVYDRRFDVESGRGIVEIWIPVEI